MGTNKKAVQEDSKNKKPLKYVIEGKEFETTNQYITGAQLKTIAGIPEDTELYLSISSPYSDELINNEDQVNLARPETEYFFVKKKLHFFINGKPFVWYKQFIRGAQIRELGGINDSEEIYLDIKDGWLDDIIEDDEIVDLARPGKERFISKVKGSEVVIFVNTRDFKWSKDEITFEEVVTLHFGQYDTSAGKGYTVSYVKGWEPKPEGILVAGKKVRVKHNMSFDVSATDKS